MGLLCYAKVGMYLYDSYEEGKFDNMINRFAYNYPTFYGRVGNFIQSPIPQSTYGYTPAARRHGYY